MDGLPELRVAWLLLLAAASGAVAWRVGRRLQPGDFAAAVADAGLLWLAIAYLAVGLPGLAGALSPMSITLATAALSAAAIARAPRPPPVADGAARPDPSRRGDRPARLGLIAVLALFGSLVWQQWYLPPMASDALIYHLPAAGQWLRDGAITLLPTWGHNPANTFSPLGASLWMTWWAAPLGHDFAARFVQAPALPLLFASVAGIARSAGAGAGAAATIAVAACLLRPVISQATLCKDDLLAAALLLCAARALLRTGEPLAAARVGLAIGLLIAIKFTALLLLPALLPLLPLARPTRRGARLAIGAVVIAAALAGPWFLRNAILTGNPLFPVAAPGLPGLFTTASDPRLHEPAALWRVVTEGYFAAPVALAVVLGAGAAAAWALAARRWREPAIRLILFGPLLGLAAFAAFSPFAEIRFITPVFALLALAPAVLPGRAGVAAAVVVLAAAAATAFVPQLLLRVAPPAAALAVASLAAGRLWDRRPRARPVAAAIALLALAAMVYIHWPATVATYAEIRARSWTRPDAYGELAEAWAWLDAAADRDAAIAYANTPYPLPLMGFNLSRRVEHVPVAARVASPADLPWMGTRLDGTRIQRHAIAALAHAPDADAWRRRVAERRIDYLFVGRPGASQPDALPAPPEIGFAAADARFEQVFANAAAVVYRVGSGAAAR